MSWDAPTETLSFPGGQASNISCLCFEATTMSRTLHLPARAFSEHTDNIPLLNVIFQTFSISYNVLGEGMTVCGHAYRPFVL